jgi:pilus assembly protein Flp/PilA
MYDALLKQWIRFRHCDEGVTLVEYGIAIALAVAVGTGALLALGGQINTSLGVAGAAMP